MQITRRLEFDAGHRLVGHESKCSFIHGHRYVAEITVSGDQLDSVGRVIDFSKIKELVGGWIDDHWDHNFICNERDPLLNRGSFGSDVFGRKRPYIMPSGQNPTAENMAAILGQIAYELLNGHGICVRHIRLYETPNCWADHEIHYVALLPTLHEAKE